MIYAQASTLFSLFIQTLTQGQGSPQNGGSLSAYEAVDFLCFGDGKKLRKFIAGIFKRIYRTEDILN